MKTLILAILALCATGQQYPGPLPIEMSSGKPGLVRKGLVAGWDLRGGSGQTVANMVAGGAALQLGSTSGVDTSDPTRGLSGMVFDGVNDYLKTGNIAFPTTLTVCTTATTNATAPAELAMHNTATNGAFEFWHGAGDVSLRGGGTALIYGSGVVQPGIPVNVCATIYNTEASIYKNAIKVSSGTVISPKGISAPITVGAYPDGQYSFNGTISYVLIYSTALNPRQVRQNHQYLKSSMLSCCGVVIP